MSKLVVMHSIRLSGAAILFAAITIALLSQLAVHSFLPANLRRENTELGAAIFSTIGVTYAVLLAFIATSAWEQHTQAEASARREANAIDVVYRMGGGLPDPFGSGLRSDAVSYLRHIVEVEWPAQIDGFPQPDVEPLLDRISRQVIEFQPTGMGQSNIQAVLIATANDAVALRRERRLAVDGTIPDLVWIVLLTGGVLMVSVSFVLGGPKMALHLGMTGVLVASGVLILLLVLGLSSPFRGAVTIAPDAYRQVLSEMK